MKRFFLLYGFIFAILAIANNTIKENKKNENIATYNKVPTKPVTIKKSDISITGLKAQVVYRNFALNTAKD